MAPNSLRLTLLVLSSGAGALADGGAALGKAFAKVAIKNGDALANVGGISKVVAQVAEVAAETVAEEATSAPAPLVESVAPASKAIEAAEVAAASVAEKATSAPVEARVESAVPIVKTPPPVLKPLLESAASLAATPSVPISPQDCTTEVDLSKWRVAQLHFVSTVLPPKEQPHARQLLEKSFQTRLVQLQGRREQRDKARVAEARVAQPRSIPACLLDAEKCDSTHELRAWRGAKLSWIVDHTPDGPIRKAQVISVQQDFERREGELLARGEAQARGSAAAISLESVEAPHAEGWSLLATLAVVLVGLSTPALLALFNSALQGARGGCVNDGMDGDVHPGYMLCEA